MKADAASTQQPASASLPRVLPHPRLRAWTRTIAAGTVGAATLAAAGYVAHRHVRALHPQRRLPNHGVRSRAVPGHVLPGSVRHHHREEQRAVAQQIQVADAGRQAVEVAEANARGHALWRGNTCFLNAVIQLVVRAARTGLPVIVPGSPLHQLLMEPSASRTKDVIERACALSFGRQEDADEAWNRLMNPLDPGVVPSINPRPFSMERRFEKDVDFDITHDKLLVNLGDGADQGLQQLMLQQHGDMVTEAPQLLLLQLLRFDFDKGKKKPHKITRRVDVPLILTLQEASRLLPLQRQETASKWSPWVLIGAVLHLGSSATSGHYTAVIREPDGTWVHYDDTHAEPLDERSALAKASEQGYMLLYAPPHIATRIMAGQAGGKRPAKYKRL